MNISIIRVPGRRREKGPEKIFEKIIAENFPNMGKEPLTQIQEAHEYHRKYTHVGIHRDTY